MFRFSTFVWFAVVPTLHGGEQKRPFHDVFRKYSLKNASPKREQIHCSSGREAFERRIEELLVGGDRRSHINRFSLEKRRLRGKFIERFKILNGFTNVDPTKLFLMDDSTRTRNNGAKLECRQVHSDCTKLFFTNALVRDWNKLSRSVALCNSTASFTINLDRHHIPLKVN